MIRTIAWQNSATEYEAEICIADALPSVPNCTKPLLPADLLEEL